MELKENFLGMRLPDGTYTQEIPPEVLATIREAFIAELKLVPKEKAG
jgi:hypothetical protein